MLQPSPELLRSIEDALTHHHHGSYKNIQGCRQVEFSCLNPAHPDVHPSAHWHPQKMMWKCRSCDAGGGWRDICTRLGIDPDNAHHQNARRSPGRNQEPVRTYRFEHRGMVFTKARYEFPDGSKTFIWSPKFPAGVKLSDMPLYWLEDASQRPDDPVVVVEGEGVVEACWQRGILACTAAWGASARDFGDGFKVLAGREVWLAADNDEKGHDYMLAVAAHLKGIARKVRWVRVPLPPNGDLKDFFAAGGKPEAVWQGDLDSMAVEHVTSDRIRVRVPTASGPVAFDAADLLRSRHSLDCRLTVRLEGPGQPEKPYRSRMNILSSSARSSLRLDLAKMWELGAKFPWTEHINEACTAIEEAFETQDLGVDVYNIPDANEEEFLLCEILPRNQPTIMFGDGASLKSYIALYAGLCIAIGKPFPGEYVAPSFGPVLYVDYENVGEQAFRRRIVRLMKGLGLEPVPGLIQYWPGRGIPLPNQVDVLANKVRNEAIALVIIDSAAPAAGGPPEDSDAALAYFNAVAKLNTSTLNIAHINRSEDTMKPFGCYSSDTQALTRVGWRFHDDISEGDEVLAFDPSTGTTRWEAVEHVHGYRYKGEMVAIKGGSLDMLVTPNHRMVVAPGYDRRWRIRHAGELSRANWMLPYASAHENEGQTAGADFMRFLGWWLSEGTLDGNAPVLTQAEGPVAQEMRAVVGRLGFESNLWIGGRETEKPCMQLRLRKATSLGRWLAEECGRRSWDKRIPSVVWSLGQQAQETLFLAMMEGDGHWRSETTGQYATTSPQLADDVQRLAIMLGRSARIRCEGRAESHHHDRYVVLVGCRAAVAIRARNRSVEQYDGNVVCLTVPSGAYVTRRNGYMGIAGNSAFWHNEARRTWYVKRGGDPWVDDVDVGLYCRKVNDGAMPEPKVLAVHFEGRDGPVSIAHQSFLDADRNLDKLRPMPLRLRDVLAEEALTPAMIATRLGSKVETIIGYLKRSPQSFIEMGSEAGKPVWGLRVRDAS